MKREAKWDEVLPIAEMDDTPARAVGAVGSEIRRLIKAMHKLCKTDRGVGLAAPQVGCPRRVIVANVQSLRIAMVNPSIVERSGDYTSMESCLSVGRDISVRVTRSSCILVKYQDTHGVPLTGRFTGFLAAVIQHEIDHLDGINITWYASKPRGAVPKKAKS